ncbi:MAG: primosomal protein N' [Deltaproteobacteria bacterium]|nr:primosomal protein N' [Deltaproteobacteria bacterium]MDZ4347833.1 primosomal protein N' [Candidatus Binatia bacterium]
MLIEAAKFARVVIPSPLKQPLTYAVPPSARQQISVGTRVWIPLGRRKVIGVVIELLGTTSLTEIKEIEAILDERPILDSKLIRLARWISQYYIATLGEVLTTILPSSLRPQSKRTVFARAGAFSFSDMWDEKILEALRESSRGMSFETLMRKFPGDDINRALRRLESSGAIEIRESMPGRRRRSKEANFAKPAHPDSATRLALTSEQEIALGAIADRLSHGGFETFLLHGVTGSGKTEVYLRAMEQVRESGRRSLILIPEISLTPQLIDRLNARFPGRVGVLHSALSGAERWAHWWNIARGNVDVVVGARSAVFAPLPDLGLIVVDEEHDPSYKQEEGVRYNGRDVAVVRGKLTGCPVILGSATPALESYENCLRGRYRLLEITKRIYQRPLPQIDIVDLRAESAQRKSDPAVSPAGKVDYHPLVSKRLVKALIENYQRARQSLIFLNRRGFSNFLQCNTCGHVIRCSHCSVTLTLHLKRGSLCCHHCDYRRPITDSCPECKNATLREVGVGTEQIEQSLQRIVTGARVARLDRDTSGKRGVQEKLIRSWEGGEIDILVGTQIITKGHDVSGVTLVGALLADLSLNLPDFRAAERTFQLLNQVAGRSGRGDDPGQVIVQTYAPDHYVFQYLLSHDYKGFFELELEFRRALSYPPFSRLVSFCIDGPKVADVESQAKKLAAHLRERHAANSKYRDQIEILGPAPAPIAKLRGRYRWQLLLKAKQIPALLEFANLARELLPRSRKARLHIDVDPFSML